MFLGLSCISRGVTKRFWVNSMCFAYICLHTCTYLHYLVPCFVLGPPPSYHWPYGQNFPIFPCLGQVHQPLTITLTLNYSSIHIAYIFNCETLFTHYNNVFFLFHYVFHCYAHHTSFYMQSGKSKIKRARTNQRGLSITDIILGGKHFYQRFRFFFPFSVGKACICWS